LGILPKRRKRSKIMIRICPKPKLIIKIYSLFYFF
jgi:hypothetical protein